MRDICNHITCNIYLIELLCGHITQNYAYKLLSYVDDSSDIVMLELGGTVISIVR